ncbi:MAG: hypothetical protein U0Y82_00670 [Thermoleophilia bacterium]
MGSGTSLIILLFALFMVLRTLGVVAQALAQAVAALVSSMVTLIALTLVLLALILGSVQGCAQTAPAAGGLRGPGYGPADPWRTADRAPRRRRGRRASVRGFRLRFARLISGLAPPGEPACGRSGGCRPMTVKAHRPRPIGCLCSAAVG